MLWPNGASKRASGTNIGGIAATSNSTVAPHVNDIRRIEALKLTVNASGRDPANRRKQGRGSGEQPPAGQ
jgi:hypothetical protein